MKSATIKITALTAALVISHQVMSQDTSNPADKSKDATETSVQKLKNLNYTLPDAERALVAKRSINSDRAFKSTTSDTADISDTAKEALRAIVTNLSLNSNQLEGRNLAFLLSLNNRFGVINDAQLKGSLLDVDGLIKKTLFGDLYKIDITGNAAKTIYANSSNTADVAVRCSGDVDSCDYVYFYWSTSPYSLQSKNGNNCTYVRSVWCGSNLSDTTIYNESLCTTSKPVHSYTTTCEEGNGSIPAITKGTYNVSTRINSSLTLYKVNQACPFDETEGFSNQGKECSPKGNVCEHLIYQHTTNDGGIHDPVPTSMYVSCE